MWLDNIKELKKRTGMSVKQIADKTNLPERSVCRIINGETDSPTITTLIPIITALGGSFNEIFADTQAIVTNNTVGEIQKEANVTKAELDLVVAENTILKDKVSTLTSENELLKLKLMHAEELLALHNYYNKLNPNK